MSLKLWTSILSDWVKKTKLADVDDSLQHFDIAGFYQKFRENTNLKLEADLPSFLEANFPGFEIFYDESRNISSQDHVQICSLFLYYSCILSNNSFFQKCSQQLTSKQQESVMKFLGKLKETQDCKTLLTKETLSAVIREAIPSPPKINFLSSSPLRTPDKTAQTPGKNRSFEKAKELQRVKTMLDNERYERNMMEVELKQNDEKMQKLLKEQKALKQELHKVQTEITMNKDQENLSPNKAIRDDQVRTKMQKEVDARDETILNLRCEIENLTARNERSSNRISMMEKDMKELRERLCEYSAITEGQKEVIEEQYSMIQSLEWKKSELESLISANCSNKKDSSSDCLDFSFSTANTFGNSTDSGENLAKSVVEVQLKEKEAENILLNEKIQIITDEKSELEGIISAKNETIETLQNEFRENKMTNQQLTEKIEALTARLETSTSENALFKVGIQKSQVSVATMQKEIEQKLRDIKLVYREQMERSGQELLAKIKIINDEKSELEGIISAKTETIESLQNEFREHKMTNQQLAESIETMTARLESLTCENSKLKLELQSLEDQKSAVANEMESQIEELKVAHRELESRSGQELLAKNAEIQIITDEKSELEGIISAKTETIESLQNEFREHKMTNQQLAESIETMTARLESLTCENSKLKLELQSLEDQKSAVANEMESQIEELKVAHRELESRSGQELLAKNAEIQIITDEKSELEGIISAKTETIESLQNEFREHKMTNQQLAESIETMTARLQSLTCENSKLKLELQSLEDQKSAVANEMESQIEELKVAHRELESRSGQELLAKNAEIQIITDEKSELEGIISAKTETIESLQNEFREHKMTNQQLAESIETMTARLESLTCENSKLKLELQSLEDQKSAVANEMESQIEELKVAHRELESRSGKELLAKNAEIQIITDEKSELEGIISAKTETIESLQNEFREHKMTNQQLAESIETMTARLESLTCENSKLKLELQSLEDQKSAVANEMESQIEELKVAHRELESRSGQELLAKNAEIQIITDEKSELEGIISAKTETIESLQNEFREHKMTNQQLAESIETMTARLQSLTCENSKLKLELQSLEDQKSAVANEMESQIEELKVAHRELESRSGQELLAKNAEIQIITDEKSELEGIISAKTETIESLQNEFREHKMTNQQLAESIETMTARLESLTCENSKMKIELQSLEDQKSAVANEMVSQIDELKVVYREQVNRLEQELVATQTSTSSGNSRLDDLLLKLKKFESLEQEMQGLEKKHEMEKHSNQQNIAIFNAKLMAERGKKDQMKANLEALEMKLKEAEKLRQEEVNNTRCELQDKLEKMKDRMKEIFTDQMKKKNLKVEDMSRAILQQESQLQQLQQHVKQLEELNTRINKDNQSLKRENDFMCSKLRFLEGMSARESIGMPRPSTTTQLNGANFGMEDEPGEEFNNMYLQDLQTGGSEMSLDQMRLYNAAELQKRNSMYPKHMRDSYAIVGVDRNVGETEMKDGGGIFDNSQTALLPNGAKKKQSVSYTRPGPPTPGKTGGRMSIGMNSVLKDATNQEILGKKTPNRFSLFGRGKDEFLRITRPNTRERTLTPSRIKVAHRNNEKPNVKTTNGTINKKEECRKLIREQTRDSNRPNLNEQTSSAESELDQNWSDEDDQSDALPRDCPNESMRNVKRLERFNKAMKTKRVKVFNKNRRSSTDSSKYYNCLSIEDSSNSILSTPRKTFTKNFIESHYTQPNRMSDFYIPASLSKESVENVKKSESRSWRDLVILVIGVAVTLIIIQKKD